MRMRSLLTLIGIVLILGVYALTSTLLTAPPGGAGPSTAETGDVGRPSSRGLDAIDKDAGIRAEIPMEEEFDEAVEEELDVDEAPPAKGDFWGTILLADGKPAVNVGYWIEEDGFFDRQTGKRKMFAAEDPGLAGVLEEETEPLEGYAATNAKGEFRIETADTVRGYLWFDGPEGAAEAFDLRGMSPGVELHLLQRSKLRVHCQGLAKKDRWIVVVRPTWVDGMGKIRVGDHIRRRRRETGKSLYVQVSAYSRSVWGPDTVEVPVLSGIDYRVAGRGQSFAIRSDDHPIRSPNRKTLHLEKRYPNLRYKILGEDGSLSKQRAWILVRRIGEPSPKAGRQRGSSGSIGWMDVSPGQRLIVGALMDDGEYIRKIVLVAPDPGRQEIVLQLGTGQRPWMLESSLDLVPGRIQDQDSAMHSCYLLARGMITGIDFQKWFEQPAGAGFGLVPHWGKGYRLYVAGKKSPGPLLCLDRAGRAWVGKISASTRSYELEEIPSTAFEEVDTQAVHRAQRGRFLLEFQVEIVHGTNRRWVSLERCWLPPSEGAWPVWKKRAPSLWRARLAVRKGAKVLHMPLGRH